MQALCINLLDRCKGDARLSTEDGRCEDELFLQLFVESYLLTAPAGCGACALPWIVYPNHPTRRRLLPYYGAAASVPAANAETLCLAIDLVSAGLGACVAPESLVRGRPGVEIRPIWASKCRDVWACGMPCNRSTIPSWLHWSSSCAPIDHPASSASGCLRPP